LFTLTIIHIEVFLKLVTLNVEFTAWNQGVTWYSKILNQTIEHPYYNDSGLTLSSYLKQKKAQNWAKSVPPKLLTALLGFEHKYQELSLSCLWFVSRSLAAQALLLSSPFLTWLIVQYAVKHQIPAEDVWPMFSLKRPEILTLEGLPAERKLVKFLDKWDKHGIAVKEFKTIKHIIIQNGTDDICQFKYLNHQFLYLLEQSPELLTYPFIQSLPGKEGLKEVLMLLADTQLIGSHLEPDRIRGKLKKCKSLIGLKKMHNEYMCRDREFVDNLKLGNLFPVSPIPSTSNIRSIMLKRELIIEGIEMEHCVASYYPEIIKGTYFVYRIFTPQRATLGMTWKNGKLSIDQIQLYGNQSPSKETEDVVKRWLDNFLNKG